MLFFLPKIEQHLVKRMNSISHPHQSSNIVSLTYGGIQGSPDLLVLNHLKSINAKGTFFFDSKLNIDNLKDWQALLDIGHEIGNGTLLSAALADGTLPLWTPEMILDCINQDDELLKESFNVSDTAVCLPIGAPRCNLNEDYTEFLPKGRMILSGVYGINNTHKKYERPYYRIVANGMKPEDLIHIIETVADESWIIFYFDLSSSIPGFNSDDHEQFCLRLKDMPVTLQNTGINQVYKGIKTIKKGVELGIV